MRLGFWNRLAIVAFIVGVPAASFYAIVQKEHELSTMRETFLADCERRVMESRKPPELYRQLTECRDAFNFKPGSPYTIKGSHWKFYLQSFAVLGLLIYALIAAVIWVAKWVWRGRAPD